MGFAGPVADGAGLHDAAANIRNGDAADHFAVGLAKHDEWTGSVGGDVLGIAAQPPPEARASKVIRRPDRLPWSQIFTAEIAQTGPLREVRHLRRAKQQPVASRRERGRSAGWQPKQRHEKCSPEPDLPAAASPNAAALLISTWSILPQKRPPCPDPCRCQAQQRPGGCATSARARHFALIRR